MGPGSHRSNSVAAHLSPNLEAAVYAFVAQHRYGGVSTISADALLSPRL